MFPTYEDEIEIIEDEEIGKKWDNGKVRMDLLPRRALLEVAKVLTYGANKYGACNWQRVEPFNRRYLSALFRHLWAWTLGEELDSETGLHNLAHAATNVLFLLAGVTGFDPEF